ncbi:MAG: radical SAM protein [Candidatus Omnitrophica bacterium]|nr:radical SAM protein [Candidatus Omnitrophota bacterium]
METNFLFISAAGAPKILSDFIPDNGLGALAGALINEGQTVKILDFNQPSVFSEVFSEDVKRFLEEFSYNVFIEEKKPSFKQIARLKLAERALEKNKRAFSLRLGKYIEEFIERENVKCAGFKLWAGDGFRWSLEAGRYLKKRHPELKIFGGGPQVDIFGQEIYRAGDFFDALCYGEGEETVKLLADFANGRKRLEDIPNVIFRRDDGSVVKTPRNYIEDMDKLPMPVYTPDVYLNINEKLKMLVLDESRGCPNSCHFCIHPVKSGKRRSKSASRIIEEIKCGRDKYGIRLFRYAGSNTPAGLMAEAAEKIINENIDVQYTSFGHINDFDADFGMLKKSGCESLFFGLESADEAVLEKGMNKKIDLTQAKKIIKNCKEAGIFAVVSVIYPAPFETAGTREKTIAFLKEAKPDSVLVQFSGIYPGTMWFKHPERFNFAFDDKETYPLEVMTYQIKSLFPPSYWKPLPYRINGMPFREFAGETERFQKDLQKEGIETSISDEAYLLNKFSGFSSLKEFLNKNRCYFYSGNRKELEAEIETINYRAKNQSPSLLGYNKEEFGVNGAGK